MSPRPSAWAAPHPSVPSLGGGCEREIGGITDSLPIPPVAAAPSRSNFGCTMARPVRRLGNLPAESTSFVGRKRELADLRKKLATARIVTLVGPGGVGKTRLAIRAASDLGRAFPAGAWLVELADVRDPGLVANTVRSEEHTSELQSPYDLVCRLQIEKK